MLRPGSQEALCPQASLPASEMLFAPGLKFNFGLHDFASAQIYHALKIMPLGRGSKNLCFVPMTFAFCGLSMSGRFASVCTVQTSPMVGLFKEAVCFS